MGTAEAVSAVGHIFLKHWDVDVYFEFYDQADPPTCKGTWMSFSRPRQPGKRLLLIGLAVGAGMLAKEISMRLEAKKLDARKELGFQSSDKGIVFASPRSALQMIEGIWDADENGVFEDWSIETRKFPDSRLYFSGKDVDGDGNPDRIGMLIQTALSANTIVLRLDDGSFRVAGQEGEVLRAYFDDDGDARLERFKTRDDSGQKIGELNLPECGE